MPELLIADWIDINTHMDEDFRPKVAAIAAAHLNSASKELGRLARDQIAAGLFIPGFRSADKAPQELLQTAIDSEMQSNPGIAQVAISLWAEARENVVEELIAVTKERFPDFIDEWDWRIGWLGFAGRDFIDEILVLVEEEFAESRSEDDLDELRLAAYWISLGVFPDLVPELSQEDIEFEDSQIAISVDKQPEDKEVKELEKLPDLSAFSSSIEAKAELEQAISQSKHKLANTISVAQKVVVALKHSDLKKANTQNTKFQRLIEDLATDVDSIEQSYRRAKLWLSQAKLDRPDLEIEAQLLEPHMDETIELDAAIEGCEDILSQVEGIDQYDANRRALLDELFELDSELSQVQAELSIWDPSIEAELSQNSSIADSGSTEASLEALRGMARDVKDQFQSSSQELEQHKQATVERVLAQSATLDPDTYIEGNEGKRVSSLTEKFLSELPSRPLRRIDLELRQLQILRTETSVPSLAEKLAAEWDPTVYSSLMSELGAEGRDIESLLIFLGRKSEEAESVDVISSDAAASLVRGIDLISRHLNPYSAMTIFADGVIGQFEFDDDMSQARFCLAALCAHFSSQHPLSVGYLYQIGSDWPIEEMKGWSHVWSLTLQDQQVRLVSNDEIETNKSLLSDTEQDAGRFLVRESGLYQKLQGIKSNRHRELLRKEMLPELERIYLDLKKLEEVAMSSDVNSKLHSKIEAIYAQLEGRNSYENLVEWYANEAGKKGLRDAESFHRKACIRYLGDAVTALLHYCEALEIVLSANEKAVGAVSTEQLRNEIEEMPELHRVGAAFLSLLSRPKGNGDAEPSESLAMQQDRCVASAVLDDPQFVAQYPSLAAFLLSNRFTIESAYDYLIQDLVSQPELSESIQILIRAGGTHQLALLIEQIDLPMQEEIQRIEAERRSALSEVKRRALGQGGDPTAAELDEALGRWELASQILDAILSERETEQKIESLEEDELIQEIRTRIAEVDQMQFEMRNEIPEDARMHILEALSLIREHAEDVSLHSDLSNLLNELEYRISHSSWSEADLRKAIEEFRLVDKSETQTTEESFSLEDIRKIFSTESLMNAGLAQDDISPSQVNTRWHVLDAYLRLKQEDGFMASDLDSSSRTALVELHSFFARMMKMKRVKNPQGVPLAWETPVIYSYWELQYPKTSVLEADCIMIGVAGTPPSPSSIRAFQDFIDSKEWLKSGSFVFLFIPGITEKIYARLASSYRDNGLVIIDPTAMISLVLSEKRDQIPLGRMRSLMLNSRGAENVDVFKVNQLVRERNAIFVGRENLMRRISGSGDSYAIYGGRRIGKSSMLAAIQDQLAARDGIDALYFSFEGENDCSDDAIAGTVAKQLGLGDTIENPSEFKVAVQSHLSQHPDARLVLLLDEIDKYIIHNPERHLFIEALRSLTEIHGGRFRAIVAGFMELYDCMQGRGPYSATSDPWRRMFNDLGPLTNLKAMSAEKIVQEGFLNILGWEFEERAIPRLIVERTGGHPAFVQFYCLRLQSIVGQRGDNVIREDDIEAVFMDNSPEHSFMAHVRKTLSLNLNPVAHYLLLYLSSDVGESKSFTAEKLREISRTSSVDIPEDVFNQCLDSLIVTSVIVEFERGWYEFSVPDYPSILERLGDTQHLDMIESEIPEFLESQ